MRTRIAVLLGTAAMVLTGCGNHLAATSPEGTYVHNVQAAGGSLINRLTASDLLTYGRTYCRGFAKGWSGAQMVAISATKVQPPVPMSDAAAMVTEAAMDLCPQYKAQLK